VLEEKNCIKVFLNITGEVIYVETCLIFYDTRVSGERRTMSKVDTFG